MENAITLFIGSHLTKADNGDCLLRIQKDKHRQNQGIS